jgi:acyl phosphate:glycerol-3-phosphate acyltransferase
MVLDKLAVLYPLVAVIVAYLVGSLSFAVIVSKVMGLSDPRTFGSKNPGATNVLRAGSKSAAIATLLLDALKGWLPVVLVQRFGGFYGLEEGTQAMVGLMAFLGHLYPVFFRFVGGKGVATALGVVIATSEWLGLATGLTWAIIAFFSRYVSLASVAAAIFVPIYYIFFSGIAWHKGVLLCLIAMAVLLVWRHGANLSRLLKGTEPQLGKKRSDLQC